MAASDRLGQRANVRVARVEPERPAVVALDMDPFEYARDLAVRRNRDPILDVDGAEHLHLRSLAIRHGLDHGMHELDCRVIRQTVMTTLR